MIAKVFRFVWVISVVGVGAILLYGYAMLPEKVIVHEGETGSMEIARDTFFYITLGLLSVINVLVFVVAKVAVRQDAFKAWFYGLIITFNAFFVIAINFIALYNSGEVYDYKRLEVIIYASIGLFSFWTVCWPVYIGYKRFFSQS